MLMQTITGHLAGPGLARESGDGGGDKEAARTLGSCSWVVCNFLVPGL